MNEPCDCRNWAMTNPQEQMGDHHHKECQKYKTEQFPRLFYYEDAENFWTLAPDKIENIVSVEDSLEAGETIEIEFKRIDLTDEQVDSLPEM